MEDVLNLSSPDVLPRLDRHLLDRSFLGSDTHPTQDDAAVFSHLSLDGQDVKDLPPSVARWRRHLLSYGSEGRKKLPPAQEGCCKIKLPEVRRNLR